MKGDDMFFGMQRALQITFKKAELSMVEYYAKLPKQMQKAITAKRPGKLTKGVWFHQDNAPAHKSVVAMAAMHDFTLLDYPLCLPDLAPSGLFLFPNMIT